MGEHLSGRFLDDGWEASVDCSASPVSKLDELYGVAVVSVCGNTACMDDSLCDISSILAMPSIIWCCTGASDGIG